MRTFVKTKESAQKDAGWKVIDARGLPLGRVASKAASIIKGKHLPTYTPHVNGGDFVVIINADKVMLTGKKLDQKKYFSHSGYIGGIIETSARELLQNNPERMLRNAVKGMIPSGALGHRMIKKLKVYKGAEHPHSAQQPEPVEI